MERRLRAKHRDAVMAELRSAVDALRMTESEPGALEPLIRNRLAKIRESFGAESKEELHQLRIEAKKLRYALETARIMGIRTWRNRELALKRLQRRLGRIHDLEGLRALLPARDPVAIRAAAREAALRAAPDRGGPSVGPAAPGRKRTGPM